MSSSPAATFTCSRAPSERIEHHNDNHSQEPRLCLPSYEPATWEGSTNTASPTCGRHMSSMSGAENCLQPQNHGAVTLRSTNSKNLDEEDADHPERTQRASHRHPDFHGGRPAATSSANSRQPPVDDSESDQSSQAPRPDTAGSGWSSSSSPVESPSSSRPLSPQPFSIAAIFPTIPVVFDPGATTGRIWCPVCSSRASLLPRCSKLRPILCDSQV